MGPGTIVRVPSYQLCTFNFTASARPCPAEELLPEADHPCPCPDRLGSSPEEDASVYARSAVCPPVRGIDANPPNRCWLGRLHRTCKAPPPRRSPHRQRSDDWRYSRRSVRRPRTCLSPCPYRCTWRRLPCDCTDIPTGPDLSFVRGTRRDTHSPRS